MKVEDITLERFTNPLFIERRANQCSWPLWGEDVPLEKKRCCGRACAPGSRIPYCPIHLRARGGVGSPSEQAAARSLLSLTLKHKER